MAKLTIDDLKKIKEICEPKGVKRYLTLNTIIYDNETAKIEETIKKVKNYVDAIICWDPAIIELCKKYKIPFHVSTQASIANKESAKFYKKLGAERVVLARVLDVADTQKAETLFNINELFIQEKLVLLVIIAKVE